MSGPDLGRIGIWSMELRLGDPAESREAAAELEELGYSTLWLPGMFGGPLFDACAATLQATSRAVVATGIANVWAHTAEEAATRHAELTAAHPGRFLLGLGISHKSAVDRMNLGTYRRPLATMRGYLDELDDAEPPVPAAERCLAALKPGMRALAAERTRGTHSYFVTADHTRAARESMGPGALVAPELTVVPIADPARAREVARSFAALYLTLPNYTENLKEHGFTDDDIRDGGSDRLIDAVVAWGTTEQIRARIDEHHEAGADHVCLQVLGAGWDVERVMRGETPALPREEWRELAGVIRG